MPRPNKCACKDKAQRTSSYTFIHTVHHNRAMRSLLCRNNYGNIRHRKYAAQDGYAGAAQYKEHSDYVKSKNIKIEEPHEPLEAVQITLTTYYEHQNALPNHGCITAKMGHRMANIIILTLV